jgi:hypothetical protein
VNKTSQETKDPDQETGTGIFCISTEIKCTSIETECIGTETGEKTIDTNSKNSIKSNLLIRRIVCK